MRSCTEGCASTSVYSLSFQVSIQTDMHLTRAVGHMLTWRTLYTIKLAMMPPAHQQNCSLCSQVMLATRSSTDDALLPLR